MDSREVAMGAGEVGEAVVAAKAMGMGEETVKVPWAMGTVAVSGDRAVATRVAEAVATAAMMVAIQGVRLATDGMGAGAVWWEVEHADLEEVVATALGKAMATVAKGEATVVAVATVMRAVVEAAEGLMVEGSSAVEVWEVEVKAVGVWEAGGEVVDTQEV